MYQGASGLVVEDVDFSAKRSVDDIGLVIAAAGYEPRCTHVLETLAARCESPRPELGRRLVLLHFKEHKELETRRSAEATFSSFAPRWNLEVGADSGPEVRRALAVCMAETGEKRLLVDYSVMSRMLYLCLLDLLREGVEIVFAYSLGLYGGAEDGYPVSAVGEIEAVPGLEGLPGSSKPKVYVFGLGYDGIGAQALAHKLEADRIVVFWTDPGVNEKAASIAEERNARLISRAVARFRAPLQSVEKAVEMLSRLGLETEGAFKVVLAPIGPKPHILASGLAGYQFRHMTVLAPHVGGGGLKKDYPRIAARGEIAATRVKDEGWRARSSAGMPGPR